MQNRLTPKLRAQIIEEYEAGVRLVDILAKYKIQRGSVYHLLRKNGIELRQPRSRAERTTVPAVASTHEETISYLLDRVRKLEAQLDSST